MSKATRGFTLIELMVTVTVILVLSMIAVPMFKEVRQRAAVRGAAEQALALWQQTRLEAAKRNTWVKMGVNQQSSGARFCMGAAVASSATDTATCDCLSATTTCDVARIGFVQEEWKGVTLTSSRIGGATWPSATPTAAVVEPKLATLGADAQKGYIEFQAPTGRRNYRIRLVIDALGRGALCQPSTDTDKLSDFGGRKCL
jgi:type IV fimbrial biogenesis protein FimT